MRRRITKFDRIKAAISSVLCENCTMKQYPTSTTECHVCQDTFNKQAERVIAVTESWWLQLGKSIMYVWYGDRK